MLTPALYSFKGQEPPRHRDDPDQNHEGAPAEHRSPEPGPRKAEAPTLPAFLWNQHDRKATGLSSHSGLLHHLSDFFSCDMKEDPFKILDAQEGDLDDAFPLLPTT